MFDDRIILKINDSTNYDHYINLENSILVHYLLEYSKFHNTVSLLEEFSLIFASNKPIIIQDINSVFFIVKKDQYYTLNNDVHEFFKIHCALKYSDNVILKTSKIEFDKKLNFIALLYQVYEKTFLNTQAEHLHINDSHKTCLELKTEIAGNNINLAYQPIVNLADNSVLYFEALLRLSNSQCSDISSALQILGLYNAVDIIDTKVLDLIFKSSAKHQNTRFSFNVSNDGFYSDLWWAKLIDLASEYSTANIRVELSEKIIHKDLEYSITAVKRLKDLGLHVVLDDFGAGNVSFKDFIKLPIDGVKIDGFFAHQITESYPIQVFIDFMCKASEYMGIELVLEHIENYETLALAKSVGVKYGQGYYFTEPLSAPEWP